MHLFLSLPLSGASQFLLSLSRSVRKKEITSFILSISNHNSTSASLESSAESINSEHIAKCNRDKKIMKFEQIKWMNCKQFAWMLFLLFAVTKKSERENGNTHTWNKHSIHTHTVNALETFLFALAYFSFSVFVIIHMRWRRSFDRYKLNENKEEEAK